MDLGGAPLRCWLGLWVAGELARSPLWTAAEGAAPFHANVFGDAATALASMECTFYLCQTRPTMPASILQQLPLSLSPCSERCRDAGSEAPPPSPCHLQRRPLSVRPL